MATGELGVIDGFAGEGQLVMDRRRRLGQAFWMP
jgi:hypothetical protein